MNIQTFFKVILYILLATLIALFVISISNPLLFNSWLNTISLYMNSSVTLLGWQVVLGSSLAFLGMVMFLVYVNMMTPKKQDFHKYRSDTFKDIVWKWSWNEEKVENLWCYCPSCKEPLSFRCDHLLYQTHFVCEQCEKELCVYDGDTLHYVFTRVYRDIKRTLQKEQNINL